MRKIRIGNDIDVSWEVRTGGEELSLEGRELKVYVRSAYSRDEIADFAVDGCVVSFRYPAKMQRVTGARAVELVDTTKDVRTVCADLAFELVGHTSEEDGCGGAALSEGVGNALAQGGEDFNKYLVELKSNVLVGRPGMSAYEIWLADGHTGSEEDYMSWLRQPATDIAVDVEKAEAERKANEEARKEAEKQRTEAEAERVELAKRTETAVEKIDGFGVRIDGTEIVISTTD